MDEKLILDKTSKRMPYTIPDGFFDRLEEDVLREVLPQSSAPAEALGRKHLTLRRIMMGVAAVAACVALVIALRTSFTETSSVGLADVELAFNNLSVEDQDYLLEVWQDDIFMVDEEITDEEIILEE